ncbi:PREDICTED: uncharacterized protein LOC106114722 isoform X2 [Papilio xuthus]|nr:PREDICTED: uncharacterized protein LOC106114722 isoform X2 [Papilio xuthus]
MLMDLTDIKIYPYDGLPYKICAKCILRLESAYNFKRQCKKMNGVLWKNMAEKIWNAILKRDFNKNATPSPPTTNQMPPNTSIVHDNQIKTEQNPSQCNHSQGNVNETNNFKFGNYSSVSKTNKNSVNQCLKLNNPMLTTISMIAKKMSPHLKHNYICIGCPKQFKKIGNLKRHLVVAHSIQPNHIELKDKVVPNL